MRGWIPPLPMALGVTAFGLSWVVLFAVARNGVPFEISFAALGWVHLVALGWITLIALSVLLHVIPAFLDVDWRSDNVARAATLVFAAGVAALVGGFLASSLIALQWGAWVALLSLLTYAAAACEPLLRAITRKGMARAVARAFGTTILLLLLTAALGTLFVTALAGSAPASLLRELPKSHALLGIAGWLSLLVVGVSARTVGPIAGERSQQIWAHVLSSTALLAGAILAALGVALRLVPATLAGCGLLLLGILIFASDLWPVLLRATVPHRPPQALMACAALAGIAAGLLLIGSALGQAWGAATIYVALLGWIGSAVLAHIHHIGVRVLLTKALGEDDETRPQSVLVAPLTWATTVAYEGAVIVGAAGLFRGNADLVELAAALGLASFLMIVANLSTAYRRARQRRVSARPQVTGFE